MEVNGVNLDSTSSQEISGIVKDQNRSNQSIANQYTQGAEQGRGLLTQDNNFNQGLAYGSNPMSHAIKSRYIQDYNLKERELKSAAIKNASADHIKNLNAVTQMASEEVMQNRQKEMLKNEIDQQNKRARGAVVGNVLGIVGGVVGGIYGGAAGAQAGYAGGQGVGNAVGSS